MPLSTGVPIDTGFDELLDLDGLTPATADDAEAEYSSGLSAASYTVISQHHAYGQPADTSVSNSYLVVRDDSAAIGMPGDPHYMAIHIRRDRTAGLFHFETSPHPLPVLAQHWLIQRGADITAIAALAGHHSVPANAETIALEHRIRSSGNGLRSDASYTRNRTWDPGWKPGEAWRGDDYLVHDWYTWVILDDPLAPPGSPVRVLFEDVDYSAGTYTLTEGAFPDYESADEWTRDPRQPLPPAAATAQASERSSSARRVEVARRTFSKFPNTTLGATPTPAQPRSTDTRRTR
ncbi:hypothetical protein [Kitasatospora sp. NRRL B-11411]|uniref:hypothetical protein n=1 Tax=Kitasatospora sp. NRRL B-11411 TaxID=1463822 RepID=UPI0012FEFDA8|nr:hypothetical protein [Kitasatospora sp. NRRL B-11411]